MSESKNDSNEFMKFVEEYEQATIEDLDKLLEHKLSANIQISTTLFTAIIAIIAALGGIAFSLAGIAFSLIQFVPQEKLLDYAIFALVIAIFALTVIVIALVAHLFMLKLQSNKPKKLNLEVIKNVFEQYHEAKDELLKKYEYKMVAFYELEDYLRVGWNIVAQSDNQFLIRRRV